MRLERVTVYCPGFSVWGCAAVEDLYSTVGKKRVVCTYIHKAALKYVVISGNLVPISHIPFNVKILYSSLVAGLRGNVSCIHRLLFSVKTTVLPDSSAPMPQKDRTVMASCHIVFMKDHFMWYYIVFSLGFIGMLVVPGYHLNKEAKKHVQGA